DHVMRKPGQSVNVRVPMDVALYILNAKRSALQDMEAKFSMSVMISADPKMTGNHFVIDRVEGRPGHEHVRPAHVSVDTTDMVDVAEEDATEAASENDGEESNQPARRKRRRRGGRGRSDGDDRGGNN